MPDNRLIIRDIQKNITGKNDEYVELSAEVDGYRIYFRTSREFDLPVCAEPFVGVALLEAMCRNADIVIDQEVALSEKLAAALREIQSIYKCWNSDLSVIKIIARQEPQSEDHERVSCYFSAGVDASHTALRHLDKISHLVMIGNFEISGNSPESWQRSIEKQSRFAQSIGKQFMPIWTNAKEWIHEKKIFWGFAQGVILCSMASLLQSRIVYIASGATYRDASPWGSHPLTDPLWSTEATKIVHDGACFRRGQKIKELCQNQLFIDNIKVCWESEDENCGQCSKCFRTMLALKLLGATSKALPELADESKALKMLRPTGPASLQPLESMIILAYAAGDKKVLKTLISFRRRYIIREFILQFEKYILKPGFKRIYRKVFKKIWGDGYYKLRVTMLSDNHLKD
jgi:hypothetical protein